MSKKAAFLVFLCAAAGLLASIAASYVHYHILFDPTYPSFCDVSATVNCTEAYTSRFGTFRNGQRVNEEVELASGDKLQFGEVTAVLEQRVDEKDLLSEDHLVTEGPGTILKKVATTES